MKNSGTISSQAGGAQAPRLVELMGVGLALGGGRILQGIEFTLRQGQCWGILGQSGAGKSNFLRVLRGETWPAPDAGTRRYFVEGGERKSPIAFKAISRLVSSELLDRYQRLRLRMSIREMVRTGFDDSIYLHHRLDDRKEARVEEVLAQLDIFNLADRRLDTLSRGQARKVLLARALVARPQALFLDECCEDLDAASRDLVLGILAEMAQEGASIVYATHRPVELIPIFRNIALFQNGTITAQGPRREMEPALRSFSPAPHSVPDPARPQPAEPNADSFLVDLQGAEVYLDRQLILQGINWRILRGEHWAVWGQNGAGKTTLLKLLCGDLRPAGGGAVRWFGGKQNHNLWELRQKISLVSAQFQTRHEHAQTGLETVLSGFTGSIGATRRRPGRAELEAARHWLDFLGISHLAQRDVRSLSYGQLRGLLIARAMVTGPEMLLLDEPLAGLDPGFRREVLGMIQRLAGQGVSLILVTHHQEDIVRALGNLLVLEKGRVTYQGPLDGHPLA